MVLSAPVSIRMGKLELLFFPLWINALTVGPLLDVPGLFIFLIFISCFLCMAMAFILHQLTWLQDYSGITTARIAIARAGSRVCQLSCDAGPDRVGILQFLASFRQRSE